MRATLLILGAIAEGLGILLVAAPDLVPGAVRLSHWTRVRWRPIENRIRRLFHLPGRNVVVTASAAGAIALTGRGSGLTSIDPKATLEQKVGFLLRRDEEAQRHVNALAARVADMETESASRLDELRGEMEAHVERKLAAAQEDYRAARIWGTIALGAGLLMTTIANFA